MSRSASTTREFRRTRTGRGASFPPRRGTGSRSIGPVQDRRRAPCLPSSTHWCRRSTACRRWTHCACSTRRAKTCHGSTDPRDSPRRSSDSSRRLSERGAGRDRSTTLSQAVGETVARERFRRGGASPLGHRCELPGGYFADLSIGDRLVVECEGYAAHGDKDVFERDRERFAFLRSCGYLVLNFSHSRSSTTGRACSAPCSSSCDAAGT